MIQVVNLVYKIIKIYKNDKKIDKSECFSTVLIEKEKITLFNELIDTKIDELIDLITEIEAQYNGNVIDPKYHDIKSV